MKFHTKRIRRLRRLALAGCIVAVVAPSSASAMLPDRGPDRLAQAQQQQYTLPSNFRTEVQTTAAQQKPNHLTLPSNFRTEVQTAAPDRTVNVFTLHKGFRPEVQTPQPASVSASSPAVVHQIETVGNDSSNTLWIVLASVAIAIALCSLAYSSIRVTNVRRELGSH
jgi:hypothetical protein